MCVLDLVNPEKSLYYCCCTENYCNGHPKIRFPTVPPPNSTTNTPTVASVTPSLANNAPSESSTGKIYVSFVCILVYTYVGSGVIIIPYSQKPLQVKTFANVAYIQSCVPCPFAHKVLPKTTFANFAATLLTFSPAKVSSHAVRI